MEDGDGWTRSLSLAEEGLNIKNGPHFILKACLLWSCTGGYLLATTAMTGQLDITAMGSSQVLENSNIVALFSTKSPSAINLRKPLIFLFPFLDFRSYTYFVFAIIPILILQQSELLVKASLKVS
ncbi:hypothetical protein QOT17_017949 [Balamuthia mandrillaris]